ALSMNDRTLRLCEVGTGRQSLIAQPRQISSVAFTPDSQTVAAASGDKITLWDTNPERQESAFQGLVGGTRPVVAYSPDNKTLAYAAPGGLVRLCEPTTQRALVTLKALGNDIGTIAFSHDSKRMAAAGHAGAKVWDLTTMHELAAFDAGTQEF